MINHKERREHKERKNEKNMLFWSLVPFSLRSLVFVPLAGNYSSIQHPEDRSQNSSGI